MPRHRLLGGSSPWLGHEFPSGAGYRWPLWLKGAPFLLDDACLADLALLFDLLAAAPQSRLAIDRFLMDVIELLERAADSVDGRGGAPGWFSRALDELSEHPELLREGLSALARIAGRSLDHVNRTCRRYLAKTATDIVNELRLEQATRLLRASDLEIVDISLACGFDNLSHFYHLFKSRRGLPPTRFRNRELSIIRRHKGETVREAPLPAV